LKLGGGICDKFWLLDDQLEDGDTEDKDIDVDIHDDCLCFIEQSSKMIS
jgi:hypothetical protein